VLVAFVPVHTELEQHAFGGGVGIEPDIGAPLEFAIELVLQFRARAV